VSATKPRVRTECRGLGFRGGVHRQSRMFSPLARKIARRIFLAASLAVGTGLRSWHELILMEAEPLMAGEKLLCPSLNTSVRNAITSSKPSSSANSGRNARSATPPSLTLNSPCLRFRPRGRPAGRHLPAARAVPAAIRAELEPARSAIWIDGCSGFGFRASGFGGSFRVPCPSPKQEPEAAAAYAVGSVPAPL